MTVLLQISDPHFGTELPQVVAALECFVHELRPGVLLLSGDIAQRATALQFAAARFCRATRCAYRAGHSRQPRHPAVQLGRALVRPYAHFARAFGGLLEPQYEDDEVLVLAVNTTRWYRHADGEVSAAQIERVALPNLPRAVWAVQAGTAVSRRVRADAGNSVNVFRLGTDLAATDAGGSAALRRCVVERWDHGQTTQRFERVSVHEVWSEHEYEPRNGS